VNASNQDATRYGHSPAAWDAAREEMRRLLIGRAGEGRTIAYSDLVYQVKTIKLEPDSDALAAMLGEISEEEDALGHGMLSVLVVHKDGDGRPGPGFFQLAKKLERDTSDRDQCWVNEFNHVLSVWQR
jgi:hypothetical protein